MENDLCRVCLKRPEIPDERHGRCEACVKAQRVALRFRLGPDSTGHGLLVKAGELSPRALKQKWNATLRTFTGTPSVKPHLGLHEVEIITTKDRIDTIRISQDLAQHVDEVLPLLRAASERTDGAW
ncbi:MAG: hypothetical protein ACP5OR_00795 [Candidatus Dormibacteria bacterium]